jgi:hypothetical protein
MKSCHEHNERVASYNKLIYICTLGAVESDILQGGGLQSTKSIEAVGAIIGKHLLAECSRRLIPIWRVQLYLVVEKARAAFAEERTKRGVVLAATLGAEVRRAAESWVEDLNSWRLADIIEKKGGSKKYKKFELVSSGSVFPFPSSIPEQSKKIGAV